MLTLAYGGEALLRVGKVEGEGHGSEDAENVNKESVEGV